MDTRDSSSERDENRSAMPGSFIGDPREKWSDALRFIWGATTSGTDSRTSSSIHSKPVALQHKIEELERKIRKSHVEIQDVKRQINPPSSIIGSCFSSMYNSTTSAASSVGCSIGASILRFAANRVSPPKPRRVDRRSRYTESSIFDGTRTFVSSVRTAIQDSFSTAVSYSRAGAQWAFDTARSAASGLASNVKWALGYNGQNTKSGRSSWNTLEGVRSRAGFQKSPVGSHDWSLLRCSRQHEKSD